MKGLVLTAAVVLCGCATQSLKDGYERTYYSLVIDDVTYECFPYDPPATERMAIPDGLVKAEPVLCERVQPPDYAPCRVDFEGESPEVWCPYPPGYLWKYALPPREESI